MIVGSSIQGIVLSIFTLTTAPHFRSKRRHLLETTSAPVSGWKSYSSSVQASAETQPTTIVLGAGVIGLTTALELSIKVPASEILLVAHKLPGDRDAAYCSPWAGGNWLSAAIDGGRIEKWDAITFKKFQELAIHSPEAGITACPIRALFDNPLEEAGILSLNDGGKRKLWYQDLVGGFRWLEDENLPEGVQFGFECGSFVVDVQKYLPWLQNQVLKAGITIRRDVYPSLQSLFAAYPKTHHFINCTGLGSLKLVGVEDKALYPSRGQTLLVASPKVPLTKMHFRSPSRTNNNTTYVFPRGDNGGVILGGCRGDGDWNTKEDPELTEQIKKHAVELCPELGKVEDLKVLSVGVGFRPSRIGGVRIARELVDERVVVHNYGAGGTGYQGSWGMAKEAVDLLSPDALESKL